MAPKTVSLTDVEFAWDKRQPPLLKIDAFGVDRGEHVFLRGPSGSGKSTLLGLIAGVLTPTSGDIQVLGQDLSGLSGGARDGFRADHMGVVFQLFNLVPYLSVAENVALPVQFSKRRKTQLDGSLADETHRLLSALGLEGRDLLSRQARNLSVGQQQRVAAARALIGRPELVICDEPTSALDSDSRDRFIDLLSAEIARHQASLIFVSHDAALASRFDRAIDLHDINTASAATLEPTF
ncbi:MAG: ABC transporter ATP-binding protein [Pseudomonadota bacterium]